VFILNRPRPPVMETSAESEPAPDRPEARPEWRSLSHLRDRVEAAVREIERLRAENVALAERLAALQAERDEAPSFVFGDDEEPEAVRAKVQGFIDLVDGLLAAGEAVGGDGAADEQEAA